jgi:hypothetical protein
VQELAPQQRRHPIELEERRRRELQRQDRFVSAAFVQVGSFLEIG